MLPDCPTRLSCAARASACGPVTGWPYSNPVKLASVARDGATKAAKPLAVISRTRRSALSRLAETSQLNHEASRLCASGRSRLWSFGARRGCRRLCRARSLRNGRRSHSGRRRRAESGAAGAAAAGWRAASPGWRASCAAAIGSATAGSPVAARRPAVRAENPPALPRVGRIEVDRVAAHAVFGRSTWRIRVARTGQ